jgi:hypothetical protein
MSFSAVSAVRPLFAGFVFAVGVFWSGEVVMNGKSAMVSTAHAVIGRPATPMSYAGVARRTTRRAATVGAGAAAAGTAAYYSSSCVQTVDAYGRIYTSC